MGAVETGLRCEEVAERQNTYGRNELEEVKPVHPFIVFLSQFKDLLVIILIAAAIISMVSGELESTIVILAVITMNAILGTVQSIKAQKSLDALKQLSTPHSRVLRDGTLMEVSSQELTVGDILFLEAGDVVGADGRIIENHSLQVNESSLTGESTNVDKSDGLIHDDCALADRANMVYSSGLVTYGRAVVLVTATGMDTEIGKIAALMNATKEKKTPLQISLDQFGSRLAMAIMVICGLVFLLSLYRDMPILDSLMFAVALAVAAIPEALSSIVTIVQAMGTQKMAREHAIIKELKAVESLGCVSVICSDKTGTLTQNKMTVQNIYVNNETISIDRLDLRNQLHRYLLYDAILTNDSSIVDGKGIGDPTEFALVEMGRKATVDENLLRELMPRLEEIPFDSIRKRMTTLHRTPNGYLAITKGAPEFILANCHSYLDKDGSTRPLTHTMRHRLNEQIENYTANALRVIALGFCLHKSRPDNNSLESHLVFLGMAGLIDPPRPEAYAAVKNCQHAGIRPIMITGDHKNTAAAIGKELGICQTKDEVITGADLDTISDRSLPTALKKYHVFARVSPAHKVRLVKGYQAMGNVVAMTGDGVNDAPALKAADIGCAMGRTGTDVAKNASDIILMDDNFSTIVSAVREGRGIYDNIKKAIHFLLSCNIGEIMTIFVAIFFGLSAPLLPVQLLFINLVTDSFPALCLGVEPPDPDSMNRPPLSKNESIFHFDTVFQMVLEGMFIGSLALFAYTSGNSTMCFAVLSLSQLVHSFNMRSEHSLLETGILGNKKLLFSVLFCIVLQCLVICMPVLQPIFHTQSLNLREWVVVGILSLMPIPLMEISKRLHG